MTGRIVKGVGGLYTVAGNDGAVYSCRARGVFKIQDITPLIGDLVEVSSIDDKNNGYLTEIFARKNELLRPRAANIDVILVVVSAVKPTFSYKLLDALICVCEDSVENCDIALCLTKTDLAENNGFLEVYGKTFNTFVTSAAQGTGIAELQQFLKGKTTIVAGASGVGKSSLLNTLSPTIAMEIGGLSRKIGRGRHTTRHAELFAIDENTFVVDSPGFSSVAVEKIPVERLQYCFKEFLPFIGKCRYSDCTHISEDECAVKAALGAEIGEARYQNYVNFYNNRV